MNIDMILTIYQRTVRQTDKMTAISPTPCGGITMISHQLVLLSKKSIPDVWSGSVSNGGKIVLLLVASVTTMSLRAALK